MNGEKTLVVGLGPAGLGFLFRLTDHSPQFSEGIVAIDQGPGLEERLASCVRPIDQGLLTQGFGGAGLFSDGKFCLSLQVGGKLDELLKLDELVRLERDVDELFQSFLNSPNIIYPEESPQLVSQLISQGL